MKFTEIIKNISGVKAFGGDAEVCGVCADSRKVRKGDLFICYKGSRHDSHDYIDDALKAGAVAVICESDAPHGVPFAEVNDGRAAVAKAARAFYGFADEKLKIVAVTGTNGKTTTTYMLKSIFDAAGAKTAVIGTLGISYSDKFIAPELTTPDPVFLHETLADMVKCGVEYVFMEVSAHALYFGKIDGIKFKAGVFTNLTQDHLDFFGTMEEYGKSKAALFESGRCEYAVINSDDTFGAKLLKTAKNAVSYGLENPADVFAVNIEEKINGTSFVINLFDELYDVTVSMPAIHNVYNALAAATCAKILGAKTETIAKGLSSLKGVNGRLEKVAEYNGATIFVDFAHTPDGLKKSLISLKKLCKGKLYCVFGCGGNRDAGKRPLMGEIAAKYSDFVIVTSDNPRYEDPYGIISQITDGVKAAGGHFVAVTEREAATEYAVNLLNKGDVLLVAGKGGETYQEIMGIKHDYNDNTIIKKIIN